MVLVGIFLAIFAVVALRRRKAEALRASALGDPDAQILALVRAGWRIENDDGRYVFMVSGQRVNHLLHFFVGIVTLGFWWVMWLILAVTGGELRVTIIRPQ